MQKWASDQYTKAICDICGFTYPLSELKDVPLSAKGSPSNRNSGSKACPTCFDEPHPQSFLSLAMRSHGADAEAIKEPRPDTFEPYLATAKLSPSTVSRGTPARVAAIAVFSGYSVSVSAEDDIAVSEVVLMTPTRVSFTVLADPALPAGQYDITVTDASGYSFVGSLTVS